MFSPEFGYAVCSEHRSTDMPKLPAVSQAYSVEQADAALRRAAERERNTVRITAGQRRALAERNGHDPSQKPR